MFYPPYMNHAHTLVYIVSAVQKLSTHHSALQKYSIAYIEIIDFSVFLVKRVTLMVY